MWRANKILSDFYRRSIEGPYQFHHSLVWKLRCSGQGGSPGFDQTCWGHLRSSLPLHSRAFTTPGSSGGHEASSGTEQTNNTASSHCRHQADATGVWSPGWLTVSTHRPSGLWRTFSHTSPPITTTDSSGLSFVSAWFKFFTTAEITQPFNNSHSPRCYVSGLLLSCFLI